MNWKMQLVLLFGKLSKPVGSGEVDIISQRKKADKAARLGTLLFDTKVSVYKTTDVKAGDIPLRIYQNSDKHDQPVLIYYHGGGFALYGIDSHDNVCRRLCKMNNCMVVSVDYRLAPEHTFPAGHNDAMNAVHWVVKNIKNYGGNAASLIVAGDSAGGNLSACIAHRCKEEGVVLKAQILIYPWIDGKLNNPSIDKNGKGYLLEKPSLFWYQATYTPNKEDRLAPAVSPCYEKDHTGLAPAFILTAEFDPLLDDGYNYYQQLKAAGNKVIYKEYKNMIHGFFNIPGVGAEGTEAYKDIAAFVKSLV